MAYEELPDLLKRLSIDASEEMVAVVFGPVQQWPHEQVCYTDFLVCLALGFLLNDFKCKSLVRIRSMTPGAAPHAHAHARASGGAGGVLHLHSSSISSSARGGEEASPQRNDHATGCASTSLKSMGCAAVGVTTGSPREHGGLARGASLNNPSITTLRGVDVEKEYVAASPPPSPTAAQVLSLAQETVRSALRTGSRRQLLECGSAVATTTSAPAPSALGSHHLDSSAHFTTQLPQAAAQPHASAMARAESGHGGKPGQGRADYHDSDVAVPSSGSGAMVAREETSHAPLAIRVAHLHPHASPSSRVMESTYLESCEATPGSMHLAASDSVLDVTSAANMPHTIPATVAASQLVPPVSIVPNPRPYVQIHVLRGVLASAARHGLPFVLPTRCVTTLTCSAIAESFMPGGALQQLPLMRPRLQMRLLPQLLQWQRCSCTKSSNLRRAARHRSASTR
ncbi:MAG: hypothetical protein EOO41_03665 [Methanobacteriota archaeon]|nr:MAG: hypothetical protein EOO41_03665 [Euryarchaeota archaeon]